MEKTIKITMKITFWMKYALFLLKAAAFFRSQRLAKYAVRISETKNLVKVC